MFLNKIELPKHEIAETIFLTAEKHLANSKIAESIFLKLSNAVHLWTNTPHAKFLPLYVLLCFYLVTNEKIKVLKVQSCTYTST